MILKALAILLAVTLILLVMAATRPNTVQRAAIRIDRRSPEAVFALIDDFHEWPRWAPQDREDPTMQRTYSGPDRGVGAVSDWHGKGSTGRGNDDYRLSPGSKDSSSRPLSSSPLRHTTLTNSSCRD